MRCRRGSCAGIAAVCAGAAALLLRGVEEERAGDGGVEAFNGSGAGESDAGVGEGKELGREARALVADEESDRLSEVESVGGLCRGVAYGGEEVDAAGGEVADGVEGGGNGGEAEDGAGGGAEGFAVPEACGAGKQEAAGGAEGLCRAKEGAEVAGILDGVEDEEQGRGGGRATAAEGVVDREVRRVDEGGDAL